MARRVAKTTPAVDMGSLFDEPLVPSKSVSHYQGESIPVPKPSPAKVSSSATKESAREMCDSMSDESTKQNGEMRIKRFEFAQALKDIEGSWRDTWHGAHDEAERILGRKPATSSDWAEAIALLSSRQSKPVPKM